jgi:nucleotide-binding universal stress UspA family protein
MSQIRSMLALTDFSVHSRHAVERAAMLAETLEVPLRVVHFLETPWLDRLRRLLGGAAPTKDEVQVRAETSLADLARTAIASRAVAVTTEVLDAGGVTAMIEAASEHDLTVLGARGSHPVRELALGTSAQRMLRQCRGPVLVVKRKPHAPYVGAMVAVDFSIHAHAASWVMELLAAQAEVDVVHVAEVPHEGQMTYASVAPAAIEEYRAKVVLEAESDLRAFLQKLPATTQDWRPRVLTGYAPAALAEFVRRRSPDLVVVGKRGQSLTAELLMGSVSLHLLAQTHGDLLVVRGAAAGVPAG